MMETGAVEARCVPPKSKSISIIVATKDRPADVDRLLQSMDRTGCFDVADCLLIDQSEDTLTRDVALGFPSVSYFSQDLVGKSRALNLGLRLSSNELLAFTDDDCEVSPGWLEAGSRCLRNDPTAGIVFGNFVPIPHNPDSDFVPGITFPETKRVAGHGWRTRGLIGMGGNMFARRSLFEVLGGFDEDLGPGGPLRTGEECELTYRALRAGYTVIQEPAAEVVHWGLRPRAGGQADRLISDGFFAIGAGLGKHFRDRDARALIAAVLDTSIAGGEFARALARLSRPHQIRRVLVSWQGFALGALKGPNRGDLRLSDGRSAASYSPPSA